MYFLGCFSCCVAACGVGDWRAGVVMSDYGYQSTNQETMKNVTSYLLIKMSFFARLVVHFSGKSTSKEYKDIIIIFTKKKKKNDGKNW